MLDIVSLKGIWGVATISPGILKSTVFGAGLS